MLHDPTSPHPNLRHLHRDLKRFQRTGVSSSTGHHPCHSCSWEVPEALFSGGPRQSAGSSFLHSHSHHPLLTAHKPPIPTTLLMQSNVASLVCPLIIAEDLCPASSSSTSPPPTSLKGSVMGAPQERLST